MPVDLRPVRENSSTGLVHPTHLEGREIWLDPEVKQLVHKLHYGDPTLGWEGDPRLAIYRTVDRVWELWRLEFDNQYRLVCRSKPGLSLDNRLILQLVAHDAQRGYNPGAEVTAHNQQLERTRDAEGDAKLAQTMEKVYWAANKDIGHHY